MKFLAKIRTIQKHKMDFNQTKDKNKIEIVKYTVR